MEISTIIIETKANYGRDAYLALIDNIVQFDDSEGEYGPIIFDLSILEAKIKEHKELLKNNT